MVGGGWRWLAAVIGGVGDGWLWLVVVGGCWWW